MFSVEGSTVTLDPQIEVQGSHGEKKNVSASAPPQDTLEPLQAFHVPRGTFARFEFGQIAHSNFTRIFGFGVVRVPAAKHDNKKCNQYTLHISAHGSCKASRHALVT